MLRTFAWVAYDHLGSLLLLNLAWTGLSLPWLAAAAVLLGLAADLGGLWMAAGVLIGSELVLLSPPTLLLYVSGRAWARGEDPALRSLLGAWRPLLWRSQLLGALVLAATAVLLLNMHFYGGRAGWLGTAVAVLMSWLLLGLALASVHLLPVLAAGDCGLRLAVARAALIGLDNPLASLALLIAGGAGITLGAATGLGLFCGVLSALALLHSVAYQRLVGRYTGGVPHRERGRGWRELVRPWES